jgi:hypothetical protein
MMIAAPLNGGAVFAGKSGRKTANACEPTAMETITIAAAHFIVGALIRFRQHDKQKFYLGDLGFVQCYIVDRPHDS